ncbi:MAG: SUMF1/EgtB/PvdO family nonheme iron enzyme [Candidatus Omnitrophota bacterium]
MIKSTAVLMIGIVFFLLLVGPASADGLKVSNAKLGVQDTASHTIAVQFDMTWNNAWRDSDASISSAKGNYDAAWVFIKYSTDGGTTWNHATLKAAGGTVTSLGHGRINPTGFSSGTSTLAGSPKGLDIVVPTEAISGKKGAFVQIISGQGATVSGSLNATGVQFVWDTGTDIGTSAVNDTTAADAIIRVMAIEMVYIPTGAFYVGNYTANMGGLTGFFYGGGTTQPYQITSEGAITIANKAGDLYYVNVAGNVGDGAGTLSDNRRGGGFPKGYAAFYIMKYEITQGQYRDFLNTLTRDQQAARVETNVAAGQTVITNVFVIGNSATSYYFNGIRVISPIPAAGPITFGCDLNANGVMNESTDGEWLMANYLSWADLTAYTAWAGLRPFTELEYEKATRGMAAVVDGEGTRGSTAITQATSIITGGTASGVLGPMRGGAATCSLSREVAEASYYGVMDLTANMWERPVSVGNAAGREFMGSHGTGILSAAGGATNSDWPVPSTARGAGFRGNTWYLSSNARVSDRLFATLTYALRYSYFLGGRCSRTAP